MDSAPIILIIGFALIQNSYEVVCPVDEREVESDCMNLKQLGCDCGCQLYGHGDSLELKFVVNCTGKRFTEASMLQELPPLTEALIFVGNNIPQLPWNVLGTNTNSYLKEVDMSNNNISEILGKSYHKVSTVERLILNYNDLKISDETGPNNKHHPRIFSNFLNLRELHLTNSFADYSSEDLAEDLHDIFVQSNLTQLMKLHLEQNEIRKFKDSRIFCDLPQLMDIHLGNNLLEHIDFSIACLHHLRFIDLEYNKISTLSQTDLIAMDEVTERNQTFMIDLSHNPLNCDCNVRDFFSWLHATKVTVRNLDTLKCFDGYPRSNIGKNVKNLTQIQCLPSERYSEMLNSSNTTVPVLIGFLVCLFLLLIGTLLYMNKVHLKYQLSPILDSVSRKVQYTSIGKQDQEIDV